MSAITIVRAPKNPSKKTINNVYNTIREMTVDENLSPIQYQEAIITGINKQFSRLANICTDNLGIYIISPKIIGKHSTDNDYKMMLVSLHLPDTVPLTNFVKLTLKYHAYMYYINNLGFDLEGEFHSPRLLYRLLSNYTYNHNDTMTIEQFNMILHAFGFNKSPDNFSWEETKEFAKKMVMYGEFKYFGDY
jgi:hypothetical protein